MNILIVEDEIQTADILSQMIRQHGYQCKVVCTGREAIGKICQSAIAGFYDNMTKTGQAVNDFLGNAWQATEKTVQKGFDLVLLNIWLSDIKGYDLIPEFRRYVPDIKIIAMTGLNDRELEMKIRRQGVLYYLIKPFELSQFREILDHMEKHRS